VATLEGATSTTAAPGALDGGEADLEEALLAFTACMREEGVDLPDPALDAQGNLKIASFMADAGTVISEYGDVGELREAATTCRRHLDGVALRFASVDRTAMQDRMLAYAACMRENGFDMPDPDWDRGPGLGRGGPFRGLGPTVLQDPVFREANEACQGVFAGLVEGFGAPPEGD